MIEQVTAARIRCDFTECGSVVYSAHTDPDDVRTLAAERGWQTGDESGAVDLCPKHRSAP